MTAIVPKHIGRCEVMRRLRAGERLIRCQGAIDVAMMWPSKVAVRPAVVRDLVRLGWIEGRRDPADDRCEWYRILETAADTYPFNRAA